MSVIPSASSYYSNEQYTPSFMSGMQSAWVSNTSFSVSAGTCLDSTGVSNMFLDTSVTVDCTKTGLNGMDVGALAASTTYYKYIVGNSLNKLIQGVVLSLSASAPTLPVGCDMYRYAGYEITDSSVHLLLSYETGSMNVRTKKWDTAISVLSGGTASTLTSVVLTPALPLSQSGISVDLFVSFTPASAGNSVGFSPFGSTATAIAKLSGSVAAVAEQAVVPNVLSILNSGVPTILYINSAASCATTALVGAVRYSL